MSHVPLERQRAFLRGLNAALAPGARVVLIDNRFVEGSSTPIAERDGAGNTYQVRTLAGGTTHRVLKNFPSELELRALTSAGGGEAVYYRGLARVFTGYDFDVAGTSPSTSPDFLRRPLTQVASRHETGASTFLGATVPANSTAAAALTIALDTIFAHPNVGPFVAKQLIQRLVTSNPSGAYVARVATVFNDDGQGVKGNLAAVVKAILLDDEARSARVAARSSAGKLREPMLRFAAWARAWSANSPSDAWAIGNTSDAATRLGQSPLRSPSVFNFFRPGYVPPNSAIAAAGLVAPEFQLTNESTVVGAVNYLQRAMSGQGVGDLVADYSSLLALADDAAALVAEINLVLAADQLGNDTAATIATAVATLPGGTDALRLKRIYACLTLVVAAPEFVVLK